MIIKHPLATEKSIRMIEAENKLVFVIERNATKQMVKEEFERLFNVKIRSIQTLTTSQGQKRAYIRLMDEFPAIDLATKLGIM